MTKMRRIARGVMLNWIALATSVLVGFFLSPFVVHHLGNVAYGVWTLVVSLTSFMGLLDLGLRGAVTLFVSKNRALRNHQESSRAVSAALWMRAGVGLVIISISSVIAVAVPHFFRIPPEMYSPARWAIVIAGANLAISLTFGVFGGVLAALHRFDLLSTVTMTQTVLRATGVLWLLGHHHGIVALALWELTAALLGNTLLTTLCFRTYRELRVLLGVPSRQILSKFWAYSSYIFLINLFQQLIYYSDNLVVGAFLSASAVTFYAIGGNLLEYLRMVIASLTTTFMPLASSFEAEGQRNHLRSLLIHGTQAALLVALPIELALFFRGQTFISLWMGEQYAHTSGRVLQILLLYQLICAGNFTGGSIAFGMEKQRPLAWWAGSEGLANLSLSILLVRHIGLYGVAWGTAIPSLVINLFLFPRYVCKLVDMPLPHFLWQAWVRSGLAAAPFGVACYITDRYWTARSLAEFFLQIASIFPIFVVGVAILFWRELSMSLRRRAGLLAGAAQESS